MTLRISNSAVRRLSIYLRQLEWLLAEGRHTVSSFTLAELAAVKDTQLRKDLSYFGSFGVRGRGYDAVALAKHLRAILGLNVPWPIVLFGAGSLGTALAYYDGLRQHNLQIVAILDVSPRRIGRRIAGIKVESVTRMSAVRRRTGAQLAALAVPSAAAPQLARQVLKAGFTGLINFAPTHLNVPPEAVVYSVDLDMAFEYVTFHITRRRLKPDNQ